MEFPDDTAAGQTILQLPVPATPEGMDLVHRALSSCWGTLGESLTLASAWREAFTLAVAELAANIIQYAYPPDVPNPRFTIMLMSYPDRLVARLVDRGGRALVSEPAAVMPSVAQPLDEVSERGRGLALVRMTTDHFEYFRTAGNENIWMIAKHFPA
jgi:anti-sigma regulatory factor (Ser/Thr protein kinase)